MAKQAHINAQPNPKDIQHVLNLLNAGKLAETEIAAKKLSEKYMKWF